jgi:hypothetical protein
MINSNQITLYLDGVATPMKDPVFGVGHTGNPGDSFEDVLSAGQLSAITATAIDSGSTRASVNSASNVKFVVNTSSGDVDVNGTVEQVNDAFGGSHYSIVFLVS